MEIRATYPYGLNDRYDNEYKTENIHNVVAKNSIIN